MKIALKVTRNRFAEIAEALEAATARVIEESARRIEANTKLRSPVDTGNLRASYQPKPLNGQKTRWLISTNVEYAPPVEYGHHTRSGSFVPAQPHLTPSAEEERPRLVAAMRNLEKRLA